MGVIKENQQVKLFFKQIDGSEKELSCKVKRFEKDRLVLDSSEPLIQYIDYLQEGDEIKAKVFTPLGVKVFDAIVLDSPREPEFVIEYVENSLQIQRRDYVRVPLDVKIVIERENKEVVITQTVDISGGGVRFLDKGLFENQEKVKLSLYIPEMRMIKATAVVLSGSHLPQGQSSLVFDEIDEKDRDIIIKKCFEIQLSVE